MKTMKKFLSLTLALAMVLSLAISASAAAKITIIDGAQGAEYAAYKLLNVTDGGLKDPADPNSDHKLAYTLNDKYTSILQSVTKKTTQDEILYYISELDAEGTRDFADAVYKALETTAADYTTTTDVFDPIDQGYYLIVETKNGSNGDAYSLVMLNTAGLDNVPLTPKAEIPTLIKKIQHDDDDSWGLVGDNQIGETVNFRTESSVPKYTTDYVNYKYIIHDEMGTGLTSNVKTVADVTVKVNDTTELDKKYITVDVDTADANKFTVTIDVAAAINDKVLAPGNTLYTYYSGILNDDAVIHPSFQQNKAWLEYSIKPYDESDEDDTDTTTEVVVRDWTFYMEVQKVDGEDNTIQLTGAKFVLTNNATCNVTYTEPADDASEGADGLSSHEGLIALIKESEGVYRIATKEEIDDTAVSRVYSIDAGKPTIKGLDDGTAYYLKEVLAPDGYNLLEDLVKVEIAATYDGTDATKAPTLDMKVGGKSQGTDMTVKVENNSGVKLPSTGGIGTTIFYIVGGLLAVGAVILLVTKKKMSAAE